MQVIVVENKKQQKEFLEFRRNIYLSAAKYVDNNYFMLQEIFGRKLHFVKTVELEAVYVRDEEGIACEGVIAYAKELPGYIQLCFFEALPDKSEAVALLVETAKEYGRKHNCPRLVIGLCGHLNYGLGLLDAHKLPSADASDEERQAYERTNSFSSPGNPAYYNDYFKELGCDENRLKTYFTYSFEGKLERFAGPIRKINSCFEFKKYDRRNNKYWAKLYTDLNNLCFEDHKYYYHRDYIDDAEMLKELFLFMKEDSLIFAFMNGEPAGFIMWYPDFNELAEPGEAFGGKHFFKNLVDNKKIRTAKVMEYGVVKKYRGLGLPLALIEQFRQAAEEHGCVNAETSWVLEDNKNSTSFCETVSDFDYKSYVVYELPVNG